VAEFGGMGRWRPVASAQPRAAADGGRDAGFAREYGRRFAQRVDAAATELAEPCSAFGCLGAAF
jgi:hypothetical protein